MPGINSRSWRWLDDGVIPLATVLAYTAWAYPAFAAYMRDPLSGLQNPGFSFWLCLGLLVGATVAGKVAVHVERGVLLVMGGGFAAIAISLGAVIVPWLDRPDPWLHDPPLLRAIGAALVCALLLWWRGVRLAYADHHEETMRTFVVGTLALAAMILLAHARHGPPSLSRAGNVVWLLALLVTLAVGFLLFAFSMFLRVDQVKIVSGGEAVVAVMVVLLGGMLPVVPRPEVLSGPIVLLVSSGLLARSMLSLSWVLNTQRGYGGVRLRVDPGWLVVILSLTSAIVLVGLGLGQVLTPGAVRGVLGALRVLWMPVLAVFAFVFLTAAWVILRVLSAIFARLGLQFPEPPAEPPPEAENPTGWALNLPPLARGGIGALIVLALLALVGWILYRVAKRLYASRHTLVAVPEQRRTLFSLDLLQAQVRRTMGHLWRPRIGPFVPLDPGSAARRTVRVAYRRVLSRAIGQGIPRDRYQTPRTYAETLARLSPQLRSLLQALTAAYEAARYGTAAPSPEEVRVAQDASLQIEGSLRAGADRQDGEE
jgi:MFS family permease